MSKLIHLFERAIVYALLCLMMLAVLASTVELGLVFVRQMLKPPLLLINLEELLEFFGSLLMVVIGLELLKSIRTYLDGDRVNAEVVFLVALVAVARKVIIVDYKAIAPELLYGVAATILALGVSYFLVHRAMAARDDDKHGEP